MVCWPWLPDFSPSGTQRLFAVTHLQSGSWKPADWRPVTFSHAGRESWSVQFRGILSSQLSHGSGFGAPAPLLLLR